MSKEYPTAITVPIANFDKLARLRTKMVYPIFGVPTSGKTILSWNIAKGVQDSTKGGILYIRTEKPNQPDVEELAEMLEIKDFHYLEIPYIFIDGFKQIFTQGASQMANMEISEADAPFYNLFAYHGDFIIVERDPDTGKLTFDVPVRAKSSRDADGNYILKDGKKVKGPVFTNYIGEIMAKEKIKCVIYDSISEPMKYIFVGGLKNYPPRAEAISRLVGLHQQALASIYDAVIIDINHASVNTVNQWAKDKAYMSDSMGYKVDYQFAIDKDCKDSDAGNRKIWLTRHPFKDPYRYYIPVKFNNGHIVATGDLVDDSITK